MRSRQLRAALDEALPPGLDVVEVVEAGPGSLAERLTGGEWEVVLPGTEAHSAAAAVEQFMALDVVEVERVTQKGRRRLDARAAVVRMGLADEVDVRSDLGRAAGVPEGCVRYSNWSSGTPHRPFDPTTS